MLKIAFVCLSAGLAASMFLANPLSKRGEAPGASDTTGENRELPSLSIGEAGSRTLLSPREAEVAAQSGLMPPDIRSVLVVDTTFTHGDYVWDDDGVPEGAVQIWIDLRRQTVSVYRGGHEIASSMIAYGTQDNQTPTGSFTIKSKHRDYRSRRYGADMPYSMFITDDGIALHSSHLQPRHATHGCVGLPDDFARRVFELSDLGTRVNITRSDVKVIERALSRGRRSTN